MGVLITPAQSVFTRTHSVLLVFGAYRRETADPAAARRDRETGAALADTIAAARHYRLRLAFCRARLTDHCALGAWLPGCRPKTTDMLFEYDPPSCFSNPEIRQALRRSGVADLVFLGGPGDSDLTRSLADAQRNFPSAWQLTPSEPLQKRSTLRSVAECGSHRTGSTSTGFATARDQLRATLRIVDLHE